MVVDKQKILKNLWQLSIRQFSVRLLRNRPLTACFEQRIWTEEPEYEIRVLGIHRGVQMGVAV